MTSGGWAALISLIPSAAAAAEEVKEVSYRLQEAAGIVECVGLALRSLTRAEVQCREFDRALLKRKA